MLIALVVIKIINTFVLLNYLYNIKNKKMYVAKHKITGKIFNDYKSKRNTWRKI